MALAIDGYSFQKFPKLPLDIRLMIWEATLPGPREVGIMQGHLKTTIAEYNSQAENPGDVTSAGSQIDKSIRDQDQSSYAANSYLESLPRVTERELRTLRLPRERGVSDETWDKYEEVGNKILDLLQLGVKMEEVEDTMGIASREDLRTVLLVPIRKDFWGRHQEDPDVRWTHLTGCHLKGIRTTSRPPHILSVCRESHGVVSKHYQRVFATRTSQGETYFDFERDTLYLQQPDYRLGFNYRRFNELPAILSSISDTANLRMVNSLSVDVDGMTLWYHTHRSLHEWIADVLDICGGLRRLTLVLGESRVTEGEYEARTVDEIPFGDDTAGGWWESNRNIPGFSSPGTPLISVEWLKVDMKGLEKERLESTRHGTSSWDIPLIEYKVKMSPRMKEWMERRYREIEADAGRRTSDEDDDDEDEDEDETEVSDEN